MYRYELEKPEFSVRVADLKRGSGWTDEQVGVAVEVRRGTKWAQLDPDEAEEMAEALKVAATSARMRQEGREIDE